MKRLTTDDFIKKSKKIHGDKYDYSKSIYNGSCKKLIIICPIHGEFLQKPNNHLNGNGCYFCVKNFKLTPEKFIEKSKLIHGDKYDYTKSNYKNTRTKIEILCKLHGVFFQKPNSHLNGEGCRKCWNERSIILRSSNTSEFVERAKMIHNNYYDYSNVKYKKASKC